MTRRLCILALLGSIGGTAQAADKILYQPVPVWVKPAVSVDAAKVDGESPVMLVLDDQERLADGQVWRYTEQVTRLASQEIATAAGTLTLSWQPDKGDLIVHTIEIVRGNQRIDALAGGKTFTVIRREQQLERYSIDGVLTATMPVEGLQVGDLLRVVSSTTNREPALKGDLQAISAMPVLPARVGFARTRLLWPVATDMKWKVYADGAKTALATIGNYRELTVQGPLPKPTDLPGDAPARFAPLPIVEAASFTDWPAVSKAMAPLYATDGLIAADPTLAAAVAKIASAEREPLKRAAAALQLVQEQVRYLYNGLDNGNYTPQSPARTWASRYGDCKAKTLLLLGILRTLGIESQAILASSDMGDRVPGRLPSPMAFDHVLVHATIDGRSYWLDGTATGARYADIGDTPPLRWVLPLRNDGAGLMPVPLRAPAMPTMTATIDYDQRAGLKLPTLLHAEMRIRGPMAANLGLARTQGSKEQKDQLVGNAIATMTGRQVSLIDYKIDYDPAAAEAVIALNGLLTTPWQARDKRYRMAIDRLIGTLTFEPDRARPAWQGIPISTGAPDRMAITTRVTLPPDVGVVVFEGDTRFTKPIAGTTINRTASLDKGVVTVVDDLARSGEEIAPAAIATTRIEVAQAKTRLLTIVAPDMQPRWAMVAAARRDGRLAPLTAAFGKAIAAAPTEAEGYVNRASYFAGVYDFPSALADWNRAVAIDPTPNSLLNRAYTYRVTGNIDKAVADYQSVLTADPASYAAIRALGEIDLDAGRRDRALARVDEQIAVGGDRKWELTSLKAELLGRIGDRDAALATIDTAIAAKPGNPDLLNSRCWLKGTLNVALDTALKDCTRSIELADQPWSALDSRAMVYFRMNRLDEALADLNAVLEDQPDLAATLYMRGVVRNRRGDAAGKADVAAARTIAPLLAADYKLWGINP